MWRFSCLSEAPRRADASRARRNRRRCARWAVPALTILGLAASLSDVEVAARAAGSVTERWWSADLVSSLKQRGWEPPYFAGTVVAHPDGYHLDLARRAQASPTRNVTIGGFTYRTSDALVAAGREIFQTYDFGTHLFWDFRRAIDFATQVGDPAEYSRRYGMKRDKAGQFIGIVGVSGPAGHVVYGHSCALCHATVSSSGEVVLGTANHDFDIGLYYDALREKIRDVELVYLGDAPLEQIRFQGTGRVDPTMDSFWAPVKIPHLFALRGLESGLRSNGDTANLWMQCYRNLNGSYAVDPEIMEALMAFLISIEAPPNPHPMGELATRGAAVFQSQRCVRCHAPPYYTSGAVIPWEVIRTDPDRIENGYPKGYRVPSLLRVDLSRFLLHDGSLTSLEQLFDPTRRSPSFEPPGIPAGRRKRGAGVQGHEFGLRLSPEDRAALIAFLRTL